MGCYWLSKSVNWPQTSSVSLPIQCAVVQRQYNKRCTTVLTLQCTERAMRHFCSISSVQSKKSYGLLRCMGTYSQSPSIVAVELCCREHIGAILYFYWDQHIYLDHQASRFYFQWIFCFLYFNKMSLSNNNVYIISGGDTSGNHTLNHRAMCYPWSWTHMFYNQGSKHGITFV